MVGLIYSLARNEPCDAAGLAWKGMEPSEEEGRNVGRVRRGGQGMVESRGLWCAETVAGQVEVIGGGADDRGGCYTHARLGQ